jgi:four helix bundle protein
MSKVMCCLNLDVYKSAHRLGIDLHRFSLSLPKYELFECGSQIRRSSKSISANIVEGYGRSRYKAELIRFLVVAMASCDETIEWLRYIQACHSETADTARFIETASRISKGLHRLIDSIVAGRAR